MDIIVPIITGIVGLAVGIFTGRYLFSQWLSNIKESAQEEAKKIKEEAKREAKTIKKDKQVEAKEKFLQLKKDFEKKARKKKKEVQNDKKRVQKKEEKLDKQQKELDEKQQEIDSIREQLNKQLELVEGKKEKLEALQEEHVNKLEEVASLTKEEAKKEIRQALKKEAETEAMSYVKKKMDEAEMKANREAKKIIIETIQRTAAEQTIENSVTVFNLENEDAKGQIIGKEGRNIRALESNTGVEIVVDDTPEAVLISGYDPVRREIAKLSLEKLLKDGRVHPTHIEEVVQKTEQQIEDRIVEIGERTVVDLDIHGLDAELIRLVGKMKFRSSYGQNLLRHSRETAKLCATMAAELGLNVKKAKRAGLLHDIGKVPDSESELSHALLGKKLAEKHGEHPAVCNAIGAHHDEIEMEYAISPIIQACDAISGARPGARKQTADRYMERLQNLENIALNFEGVEKAYAIQAGRELRIIVESDEVTDKEADEISFKVSQRIQDEMQYPGHVQVTVIRENRSISYAK